MVVEILQMFKLQVDFIVALLSWYQNYKGVVKMLQEAICGLSPKGFPSLFIWPTKYHFKLLKAGHYKPRNYNNMTSYNIHIRRTRSVIARAL